jgi:hypothetical protein
MKGPGFDFRIWPRCTCRALFAAGAYSRSVSWYDRIVGGASVGNSIRGKPGPPTGLFHFYRRDGHEGAGVRAAHGLHRERRGRRRHPAELERVLDRLEMAVMERQRAPSAKLRVPLPDITSHEGQTRRRRLDSTRPSTTRWRASTARPTALRSRRISSVGKAYRVSIEWKLA